MEFTLKKYWTQLKKSKMINGARGCDIGCSPLPVSFRRNIFEI